MRIYYKAKKMLFAALFLAVFIAGCNGQDDFFGGPEGTADTTAPTVSSTNPIDTATGVALNRKISAIFSEAIRPGTCTVISFTLKQGVTSVPGTVTCVDSTATFTPTNNLSASTVYTATITTGIKDLAGNALAANKVWSFTTGTTSDTTAPTVSSTNPIDTAIGVALNSKIAAIFSEVMDPTTMSETTFTLKQGATSISGAVTYVGSTVTFTPTSNLAASTVYTATITTGVKDLAGNALAANKVWSFTTGTTSDTTAPTVSSTDPAASATSVALNTNIIANFSEAMDPATITAVTFTLKQGTTSISGDVTYAGTVATFNPTSNLAASTVYTATITTGVKDLASNALAADKVWSFTTGTTTAAGPATVPLGTAGNFAILSKSGITNVPTSAITGDIGTSPITGAAITGLGCPEVTGTIYTVDAAGPACRVIDPVRLTAAVSDMEIAYTDAAGRTLPDFTELGAGEIGGLTLAPGLYKWGTGVTISTNVTLSGGANDVWIFQIAQNLTVSNGRTVTLTGGAQAKNIFWQVAGQATLGTTSNFKGNILCQTAIVPNTGAVISGRALAQTAVTLNQNTVTKP